MKLSTSIRKKFRVTNKLKKYAIKNDTSRVPNHFVDKEGYNLGTWLNSQKQNKNS